MRVGIFDVLRGGFHDGTQLSEVPQSEWLRRSVLSNLTCLFNTRQGSVAHLPGYGLPDTAAAYRDAPDSIDQLRRAVQKAIETYEPRLQRANVRHQPSSEGPFRVTFLITGSLINGERVSFQTTFASHDLVKVDPWSRP